MGRQRPSGFTLIEMLVVLLIVGILSALAVTALVRERPESTLRSTSIELESTFRLARQEALARGVDVAVLVFPDHGEDAEHLGRIVLLQNEPVDSGLSFFDPLQDPNFASFDPANPQATANGQILDTVDLPRGVLVGPSTGFGTALPFPYAAIDTGVACSFCGTGGGRRGAVVFDAKGRTSFFNVNGSTIQRVLANAGGASFTIHSTRLEEMGDDPTFTLVITSPQGMVRAIYHE